MPRNFLGHLYGSRYVYGTCHLSPGNLSRVQQARGLLAFRECLRPSERAALCLGWTLIPGLSRGRN